MDKIVKAIPLANYQVRISTRLGVEGIFDVKPYIKGAYFEQLLDENYFNSVKNCGSSIAWPNEQDLSLGTIMFDLKY